MKIVVVDDEPTIVLMCRRVLESQGHAVQGFTDVRAALAQLEAGPPTSSSSTTRCRS